MPHQLIALFGGTFDPVHKGHLAVAECVLQALPVDQIRFIPCALPVHRDAPSATADARLTMLTLATKDNPHFFVDDCEIRRNSASYTIETLHHMRARFPENHFAWIVGYDAWLQFTTWHEWESILANCHLILVSRPHITLPKTGLLADLLQQAMTTCPDDLLTHQTGKIFLLGHCAFAESATAIRSSMNEHLADLPESVKNYIKKNKLYAH